MHCKSISTFVQHKKHLQNHPDLNCTEHLLLKISSTLHFYIGETGIIIISSKFGWYFTTLTNNRHLTFLESDLTVCVSIRPWERDWSSELLFIARNVGKECRGVENNVLKMNHDTEWDKTWPGKYSLLLFILMPRTVKLVAERQFVVIGRVYASPSWSRKVNKSLKQWSYLH